MPERTFEQPVAPRVATPRAPGEESAGPATTDLVHEFRRSSDALHALYRRMSRLWETYREFSNSPTDSSGVATINLDPLLLGWECEVERVIVVVNGASHAATLAVYRNGVNDNALLDFASALVGDTPSRLPLSYFPPLRLVGGERLVLRVTGAVASQQVFVHIEGRKREL